TAEEETGMNGALGLDGTRFIGDRLLNLDSEEEGIFTLGCAGGVRVQSSFTLRKEPADGDAVTVVLDGLLGGHSGTDIDKGRANANVLLLNALLEWCHIFSIRLSSLDGGTVDNGFPNAAKATVVLPADEMLAFMSAVQAYGDALAKRWRETEPHLSLRVTRENGKFLSASVDDTRAVLSALSGLPNGVQQMSPFFENKPETSLNMGVVRTETDCITATFALRSFRMESLYQLTETVMDLTTKAGGTATKGDAYPAWEYRDGSDFVKKAVTVYTALHGAAPQLDAVHAGLECGVFCGKRPMLECISLGPDITGAHTPQEKVSLSSLDRVYRYVCTLLAEK
ncbi:MAG: M20/M25/M40 family metallo-hydrolase, partial [Clostridia bacterium]|nr:M20/M25/M40 family metallo-hydrolase [Clostridia bacterium]